MTITRNRTSKTIVSQSIERMSVEGYTIGRIAQILGVSEQLVSSALQGDKVGPVNDKAATYYLAWQASMDRRVVAEKEVKRLQDTVAQLQAEGIDPEASDKLEAIISEQAATINALKVAFRNLI
jgi:predicted transcriptional regulator